MKKLALALALATATTAADAGSLGPYDELIVFGDSLSDPGNVFAATGGQVPDRTEFDDGTIAYPFGMWSDGVTWAHKLGATFESGNNFAFGGARAGSDNPAVPDLLEQIDFYAPSTDPAHNAVTAIFIGGNDFLKLLEDAEGDAQTPAEKAAAIGAFFFNADGSISDNGAAAIGATYANAIGAILGTPPTETDPGKPGAIQLLAAKNLTDFVIFGLPDIGKQPGLPGPFAQFLSGLADGYNTALEEGVKLLNSATPGLNLSFFDVAAALEPLFGDNSPFSELNSTCVVKEENEDGSETIVSVCTNPEDFAFYDAVHPTDAVHDFVAEAFTAHVTPVPLPAGAPLLIFALGALGVAARRRVAGRLH